jgi:hypothetical protein
MLQAGFGLGFFIGILPLAIGRYVRAVHDPFDEMLSYAWWVPAFILSGACLSYLQPSRRWIVSLVIGLGFSSSAIVMIITETLFGIARHNVWPFTLIFTLIFGTVLALIGAVFGLLASKLRKESAVM